MNDPSSQRERIGDYQILAKLSSGGMGDVYLVRRESKHRFEKLAAIKLLRSTLENNRDRRTMFLDEARLMARLDHPAIAQVYDFGEEQGQLFLVMEFVPGISFRELMQRRPPPAIAARAMADVCLGLQAAHRLTDLSGRPLKVVHRDVSPQNLMLTFDGCVKILDFGIALMRDRETQATQCGQIKGKPAYMAPEQVTGRPVDHRADLFAASIVLWELLTGDHLFKGDTVYAIARAIELAEIRPPSDLAGPLPPGLDEVVLRGLGRRPARRYQTALEMAQALNGVVSTIRGGETLDQYAARELAQDRIAHLDMLKQALASDQPLPLGPSDGRPDGQATAPLTMPPLTATTEVAELTTQAPEVSVPEERAAPPPVQAARRGLPRVVLTLGVAFFVMAATVSAWFLLRDRPAPPAGPAAAPAENPPPHPAAPPSPAHPDASLPDPSPGQPGVVELPAGLAQEPGPGATPPGDAKPKPHHRPARRPLREATARTPPPPQQPPAEGKAEAPKAFGYLTVAAEPYAEVRIDGVQAGTTPIFNRRIPAGEHEITLISPDTGTVRLQKKVTITEEKLEKVIVR